MGSGMNTAPADSPQILCTICARGGSKGVAGKNLRKMLGKPLLAYSIAQALQAEIFSAVAVSSDSDAILAAAIAQGAHFAIRRPDALSVDAAPKPPAIRQCAEEVEKLTGRSFDIFVDLDATSPLRLPQDIAGAVALLGSSGAGNVITGMPARRSPYFNLVEPDANGVVRVCKQGGSSLARRQDSPPCFDMNASVYVWRREAFFRGPRVFGPDTRLYVMPDERSLDIDSELDWELVEYLMAKRYAGSRS